MAVKKGVDMRVVRHERAFVELDRQPPEQREVGFHLGELLTADGDHARAAPPSRLECRLDHRSIGRGQTSRSRGSRTACQTAEYAVGWVDKLLCERTQRQKLPAKLRKDASVARHLEFRERRSHGLRCQTTGLDGNPLSLEISVRIDLPHEGRRIEVAEPAGTRESVIRTPVPEVVEVEYRIDHARRVARLDSSGVDLMDLKHRIGIAIADIGSLARCDADK